MRSDAQAETNFRHVRDVELFSGVEDVERHPGYLGHVTLSIACRNAADAHVHRGYRLDLVDVVALYQPVHETAARRLRQKNVYRTYSQTVFYTAAQTCALTLILALKIKDQGQIRPVLFDL